MPRTKTVRHGDLFWEYPSEVLPELAAWVATEGDKLVSNSAESVRARIVSLAPEDSGDLKSGIIVGYKENVPLGDFAHDVFFDPGMNDTFVKYVPDGDPSGKRYYYPASQNYGFQNEYMKSRKPGLYFMQIGAEAEYDNFFNSIDMAIDRIGMNWAVR